MNKTDNLYRLRKAINEALKKCRRDATPFICSMVETKEGYDIIESQILSICLNNNMQIFNAITLIECENSNNE